MLFLLLWTVAMEWPLRGTILGKVYGDPEVSSWQITSLGLTDVVQRRAEQYIWHQLGWRSCQKEIKSWQSNYLRGPTPGSSLRFAPVAFSMAGCGHKAAEVWNQSFPSPRWTAFPGKWAPSTQNNWFWGPRDLPLPLLLSVEAVLLGLEVKLRNQARSWTWLSEAVRDACHMGVLYRQWELIPTTTPGYDNLWNWIGTSYLYFRCRHSSLFGNYLPLWGLLAHLGAIQYLGPLVCVLCIRNMGVALKTPMQCMW